MVGYCGSNGKSSIQKEEYGEQEQEGKEQEQEQDREE